MPGPARRPRVAGSRRPGAVPSPAEAPVAVPQAPAASVAEAADGAGRTPSPGEPELLVVGRIGKPQGIRGEVTVQLRTDDPDARFADGAQLLTDPAERGPLTVASSRDQNGRFVVAFAGVEDRNAAEALRETLLVVDAATLPPLEDPDEFHDFQLVGLRAELPDGGRLGEVTAVLHLPHGDVLAVRRDDVAVGSPEVLVPFVRAMVPVVDVPGGRVVVDPPEGLLDLSEPEVLGPEPDPGD